MQFGRLREHDIAHGEHISTVLDLLARHDRSGEPVRPITDGVAFVTFAFDIDGVSMEIAKYAQCFEEMFPGIPVHCIAGNFGAKADAVLDPTWNRFVLDGADGWDKWHGGTWFHQLFYEDLPPTANGRARSRPRCGTRRSTSVTASRRTSTNTGSGCCSP